jgi:release factor glutamine methyltransferase
MSDASGTWTVRRILEWTTGFFSRKGVDSPRLSAELLLANVLGCPRIKLYTDHDRPLGERELTAYRALVQRAGEHEPIAYLTGRAHFFNLEFEITRDVLIPRPDTETLVENVLQLARNQVGMEAPRILDLCTGSGCIAAAIAHHLKTATVVATDVSAPAVLIARRNIERLGLSDRVTIHEGDLYEGLRPMVDSPPFHLIVSNPPYIPTAQIETLDRSVRDFEPRSALDGGLDGLVLHRRILAGASDRLLPGGRVYLEIAFDQGPLSLDVAREYEAVFDDVRLLKDHAGNTRVLTLQKKPKC